MRSRQHFEVEFFPTLPPGLRHLTRPLAFRFPTADIAIIDVEVDMVQTQDDGTDIFLYSFPAVSVAQRVAADGTPSRWCVSAIRMDRWPTRRKQEAEGQFSEAWGETMKTTVLPEHPDAKSSAGADIPLHDGWRDGQHDRQHSPPHQVNRATVHATVSELALQMVETGGLGRSDVEVSPKIRSTSGGSRDSAYRPMGNALPSQSRSL